LLPIFVCLIWYGPGANVQDVSDSYANADIDRNMHTRGHRILGNEWDAFDASRFFALDAIFATSFRKPLDRALSQFRFECIEERGVPRRTSRSFGPNGITLTKRLSVDLFKSRHSTNIHN
jgi:hypothetical protein